MRSTGIERLVDPDLAIELGHVLIQAWKTVPKFWDARDHLGFSHLMAIKPFSKKGSHLYYPFGFSMRFGDPAPTPSSL